MNDKNKFRWDEGRKQVLVAFLLGMIVALSVMGIWVGVIQRGSFVTQSELQRFQEMDASFGKYYEIQSIIEADSIYEIDASKQAQEITSSLLEAINDPYAQYMTAEQYAKFERRYRDSYTGVGISVVESDGQIVIQRVLSGGPAEDGGVLAGDILLSVDGTTPKSVDEAAELIGGEVGTELTLELKRGDIEVSVDLIRANVEEESVSIEQLTESIGVITIESFRSGTAEEFEDAMKSLTDEGVDRIIIDLRNNTGGVMDEGIACADLLLPACTIMTSRDSKGEEKTYNSDEGEADFEYVILVNGNTASASEILAGAVQKNNGGKIIGEKTYGKGLIQNVYKLSDGSALRLTVQEYFLPDGSAINEKGITPDVKVSSDRAMEVALEAWE